MKTVNLTSIETQGKKNAGQWVKTYLVYYKNTGSLIGYKENGVIKVKTINIACNLEEKGKCKSQSSLLSIF